MKKAIAFLVVFSLCQLSKGQSGEFEIQENGLIYSSSTMNSLKGIVDSLNLKFLTCENEKTFYSKYQNLGHRISITGKEARNVKADMEHNISFKDLIQKYPDIEVDTDNLVVIFNYQNYKDEPIVEFSEIGLDGDNGYSIRFDKDLENYTPKNVGNWIYRYYEKSSYSDESLTAFYFRDPFKKQKIPESVGQWINYADCLIDTTTNKFKEDLKSGWVDIPFHWRSMPRKEQETLLEKLRSTRVIGSCSQDSRPRMHAVNIAMLSAETKKWDVFLRAHLDVMNDRFERVSDGNYAWEGRKTYIRELEELNINVPELIIGISLRIDNPSKNHYFGSIRRIGRALAETRNREAVESILFATLTDPDLDLYNRILGYFLITNYTYHLTDDEAQAALRSRLNKALNTLPDPISMKIKQNTP